jgi:zinc transport system permease protein
MIDFWHALAQNPLLLAAVIAGLAASVVSGIIGSYVVVKRIVFISGSISHAVLSGIGLSLWLERSKGIAWLSPMHGALIAAIFSALLLGWIRANYRQREDSVIAALWSVGMAVGVLFISQTPGFNVELTNFLIGNILWVTPEDLITLFVMDVTVLALVMLLYNKFLAICFDEDQARLQGVSVDLLYLLLLVLTSVSIVLLIQVVGVILVMTMLTIPAAIANTYTTRLSSMMVFAVILSCLFCIVGMNLAYALDWPGGATIALVAGVAYVASMLLPVPQR